MDRRLFLTGLTGLAIAPFAPVAAEAANWVHLGTRRVRAIADHDRITVGSGAGTFDAIRLKVRGNDLLLYDLDIRFGNGGHQNVHTRLFIPQGGQTRIIDLDGTDRNIRSVAFTYGKPINWRGSTYVELWGRR